MVDKQDTIAYTQVLEVLKGLSRNEFNRIPKEKITLYEEYKDKEYVFNIDSNKEIGAQISDRAKVILANLFVRYIANKKDKEEIYNKEKEEFIKSEIEKRENIQIKPIFKEKKRENSISEQALIKVEKKGVFEKIIKKIFNFFKFKK